MKILFLTKRQYTHRDLLDDRFGRFRELPLELARLGHEVMGLCLSYTAKPESDITDYAEGTDGHVTWFSLNAGLFKPAGFIRYANRASRLTRDFKPDIIYACSDSIYVIFGVWLARRIGIRCVVDLCDAFETYSSAHIPGIPFLFCNAIRNADGVICVSAPLAERIIQYYKRDRSILVLENAVSKSLFYPRNRNACRKELGLPENALIIGTAGNLNLERGTGILFCGFEQLKEENNNLHLAIAGPRDRNISIPRGPHIHDFNILSYQKVPIFINALDVAVICNKNSLFGLYCFPQKAFEFIACHIPIVAAAVGSMKGLLKEHPECLFEPENVGSFVETMRNQLNKPTIPDLEVLTWANLAKRLESFLLDII